MGVLAAFVDARRFIFSLPDPPSDAFVIRH
ncbi:hypothetical protein NB724_000519 [Pantoea ananatis]|jgi:hypothetical protein|nr:hypothetical protein [Pantoea ananatis]MCW0315368.1 hypothetical protein [Pantoea ananatis]MCW0333063.1 hypothetical protein [Pantoea ananatis]MCW0339932.1 hypothetical protein [Pantoea ananatis]MCW0354751.1 hypothetical protein [Pantoea ananatis]